ncbi:MAG: helix-turn-helix domain-containing protein [Geminicoccaceae bacterium]|nr:helix-turn-helix domain-containing protein [Geminicoccaceae bacterium]MCX8101157.1 helix-turn-helix domain-containing protein [Geminicoccaceae bacterium]MDW8370127.1 helix-turn-helix transcriptional regulator [Geminicoccaceae bacterium]
MIGHGSSFGRRLRSLRLAKGLRQAELARLVGRHQTAIGPWERDEYAPPPDIVERLARALDTSAEYLLFGRHPRRSAIALAGRIGPGGLAEPAELGTASLRDDQLIGWRVEDETMAPAYRTGQVLLVLATAETRLDELLGRDVVAELADGRNLLRRLLPGARPEVFDLAAWNAPTLAGASLVAARRVVGVVAAEALVASTAE